MPFEIERKFLIRMPDPAALAAMPGARVRHMIQTYLLSARGVTARVRRIEENGAVTYIRTEKIRISARTAEENEWELTEEAYRGALSAADPTRRPIEKTRYAIPHGPHTLEVDIYPFWEDRAILEIELGSEEEAFTVPAYLTVLCEVTADPRYKNASLAREVPL